MGRVLPDVTGMKFCGVYKRGDRPTWYIYFPHPATGVRVQEGTPFQRGDPQGYRKALDLATEKGKAGIASKGMYRVLRLKIREPLN